MDEDSVEAYISSIKCPTLALLANQGFYGNEPDLLKRRTQMFPWIKVQFLDGSHHFHLETETCYSVAQEIHRFIDQN